MNIIKIITIGIILYTFPIISENKIIKLTKQQYYNYLLQKNNIIDYVFDVNKKYKLPEEIILGIIWKESRYNQYACGYNKKSKTFDQGYFQLNSDTFKYLTHNEFYEPYLNIAMGIRHFYYCLQEANNDIEKALWVYNMGYKQVMILHRENKKYSNDILLYSEKIKKQYLDYLSN